MNLQQFLVRKEPTLGIILDIVGIPSTASPFVALIRLFGSFDTALTHGGIRSLFLWNFALNSLSLELRCRSFYVQAHADDPAVLVTSADMLWIRGMVPKVINIAAN